MSTVKLYIRPTFSNGKRPYLDPAYFANKRLRAGHALVNGQVIPCPGASYSLRYMVNGRRSFENLGPDPDIALRELARRRHAFEAADLGLAVPAGIALPKAAEPEIAKRSLSDAIAEYQVETKNHKARKTFLAYNLTLRLFSKSCRTEYLEDLDREDLLNYIADLRNKGNGPRTIRNRVDHLQIFLHHFKLPSLLQGKDLPKFTEKKVRAYSEFELGKMLGYADQDTADLLQFFLCTGVREQEAQHACWSDVDLDRKTYTVTEHLDLGYRPKDKEEGTVPIPDSLVEVLRDRRKRHPKGRLIFPGPNGKLNGHLLRIIKSLALRAGVNCGFCVNKAGQSCLTHPVCRHVLLHKMRKTYASKLNRLNLPPRTLMRYLRHSDLETTLRYIADEDDDQTRGIVNSAFGAQGGVRDDSGRPLSDPNPLHRRCSVISGGLQASRGTSDPGSAPG
jgi:integrase